MTKALVVFSGEADVPALRFLRRGFRHCFILMRRGKYWVSCDPLLTRMEIELHDLPDDFDFPGWLRQRGLVVVEAEMPSVSYRPFFPFFFTCVEAVKRILGLRAWWIVTPWQLYRHLIGRKSRPSISTT
jgi:hypothetical protein